MTDRELILQNRLADTEQRLKIAEQKYEELAERLHLSSREAEVLAGRDDGLIPIGLARPILRRAFGSQVA